MDHNEKDSKIWNLGEVEKFKRLKSLSYILIL